MNFRRPAVLLGTFAIFTAIGVFFSFHTYLTGNGGSLAVRFYYEMTGAYAAMLVVPAMAWLVRHAPFTRSKIYASIAANIAGAVFYTLAHSTIEIAMRWLLQPAVGMTHTVAGMAGYTYLPEAPGDAVYYAFIVTSLYLLDNFVSARDLTAKLAEAKLENLRLQLHPHFLFNTLNAISSVMYEDVEKADAMLSKLSEFLRTVLDSGNVHTVSLAEELAVEQMYVDIMTTRLERNLNLRIHIEDDAKESTVPFMVLQPLIENSIRHGMGSSRTTLDVAVDVSRSNGRTVIRIDDDGLGIDAESSRGIGLTNVASRLHYMYGDAATFSIAPGPHGGTRATLTFPYSPGETPCR
jgi:two-component system, LytTR family, sensor kinase